jgi:hypothetical protein
MRIDPRRVPTTGIGLTLAARYVAAALSILIVTGPAAAVDLGVGIQAGSVGIGTGLGAGRNGTSGLGGVQAGASIGTNGVHAGASIGTSTGALGASHLGAGGSVGGVSAGVSGRLDGASRGLSARNGAASSAAGASSAPGAGGAPAGDARGRSADARARSASASKKGTVPAAASVAQAGGVRHILALPWILRPSGESGRLPVAATYTVPGTPIEVVRVCREAIESAAMPFGMVSVRAKSGGNLRRLSHGAVSAPIQVRIHYARQGGAEIRQARIGCQLDATGRVIRLT